MNTNKTALVTGAGSGLGSEIAGALARAGYDVAIHTGSNEERALELADRLRVQTGRRIEVIAADFTVPGGADELFDKFPFDRLDIFVNNAGVTMSAPILKMTDEIFDTVGNINWRNAYFCVRRAASVMIEKKIPGSIVLISSNHHALVRKGMSVYGVLKEALVKFTKHAAMEFAEYGVRVNCIAPGWIDSGKLKISKDRDGIISNIPLSRVVQPAEIAEWVLFLSGPAAASLTGDTIDLDGGVRLVSSI